MDWDKAFAGVKVIDLTGGVAGPSCAMMLAQHGADVIKVETPHAGGDWSRILGRTYQDHSAFSVYGTLGKRSVAVDLKTPEGTAILWRLIQGADVFMEGLRPGTMQRYGFGYDAVSAKEPGILYYSISGFGQTGPLASRPAMDPVLQAFIGIVNENRGDRDNHPHRFAISSDRHVHGTVGISGDLDLVVHSGTAKGEAGPLHGSKPDAGRRDAVGDSHDRPIPRTRPGDAHQHAERRVRHRRRAVERHHGAADRLAAVLRGDRAGRSAGRIRVSPRMPPAARTWTNYTPWSARCSKRSRPSGWRNGSPTATS